MRSSCTSFQIESREAQLMKWNRTKCNRLYVTQIWHDTAKGHGTLRKISTIHSSMNHWMIHNILIAENILRNSLENSMRCVASNRNTVWMGREREGSWFIWFIQSTPTTHLTRRKLNFLARVDIVYNCQCWLVFPMASDAALPRMDYSVSLSVSQSGSLSVCLSIYPNQN